MGPSVNSTVIYILYHGPIRELHGDLDRAVDNIDVAAAALYLPEVRGELLAAARQVDVLLDVLPVDPEDAPVDLQGVIEEGVLAAELIAPEAVGRVLARNVALAVGAERQAQGLQVRPADGTDAHIDATHAIAFRGAHVVEVIAVRLP